MIVGMLVRNYKTYQNINYIPLCKGKQFSALIGENGVGKSSVLEALNTFFNSTDWNYNHTVTANGFDSREPFVCPIFLIDKKRLPHQSKLRLLLASLSDTVWASGREDYNAANRKIADQFISHRDSLVDEGFDWNSHYLLPLGIIKNSASAPSEVFFSIFEPLEEEIFGDKAFDLDKDKSEQLYDLVRGLYRYVYLPSEIDFQTYTKIEGNTIQALLGRKLDDIVREFIDKNIVTSINAKLNGFLSEIADSLDGYEYKKPAKKQNLFNQSHFTEKVIEAFFETKVLTKVSKEGSTPVNNLSSGEKRRAIIDVARGFLLGAEQKNDEMVILAIDEPELSLHISACFDQFEKIKEISEHNVQTLIATHWYGFMPIISNGVAVYICHESDASQLIDLRCFRDDIKKMRESTAGQHPANIELKSINDLVQSIIASVTSADYRWVICEGASDKIYLDHFFSDKPNPPYVLPVGASKNVKRVYKYVVMALESERDDVKGKIYFLLDTDKQFEKYEANDGIPAIEMRRLMNDVTDKSTKLFLPSDTNFYPPSEMEDVLDADVFLEALSELAKDHGEVFEEFSEPLEIKSSDWPSGLALDLRETDKAVLEKVFDLPHFKIQFALKYVETDVDRRVPGWVSEIGDFLYAPKKVRVKRGK